MQLSLLPALSPFPTTTLSPSAESEEGHSEDDEKEDKGKAKGKAPGHSEGHGKPD